MKADICLTISGRIGGWQSLWFILYFHGFSVGVQVLSKSVGAYIFDTPGTVPMVATRAILVSQAAHGLIGMFLASNSNLAGSATLF